MIALEAIKFTFKNFWKLLPYYIAPFLLVTIGGALGFMPLFFQTPFVIALALVGAVLVAIGGLSDSIFATLAGAVIGILTIIFGVFAAKKAA